MSTLSELFRRAGRTPPPELSDWRDKENSWHNEYTNDFPNAELSEINVDVAVFVFDHSFERVVLAYALSIEQLTTRDYSRMRGFPDPNVSVRAEAKNTFIADRGHFLGHASGGILDINLFPQRRELNRGWSPEGKRFRKMERYVSEHPGTFFYHRAIYNDTTWIPNLLEYGILLEDSTWWKDIFSNKC